MKKIICIILILFYSSAFAHDWKRFDLSKLDYFNGLNASIKYPAGWEFQRNHRRPSIIQFVGPAQNDCVQAIMFAREKTPQKTIINQKNYIKVAQDSIKGMKSSPAMNIEYTEIEGHPAVMFDTVQRVSRAGAVMYHAMRFMNFSYKNNLIMMAYSNGCLTEENALEHFNPNTAFLYFNSLNIKN